MRHLGKFPCYVLEIDTRKAMPNGFKDMKGNDNKYTESDWRSLEMHRLIAKKLVENPSLIELAQSNISRWSSVRGKTRSYLEWEDILSSGIQRTIDILTGEDQECARLRSSSPFTGVLSEPERTDLFNRWKER